MVVVNNLMHGFILARSHVVSYALVFAVTTCMPLLPLWKACYLRIIYDLGTY